LNNDDKLYKENLKKLSHFAKDMTDKENLCHITGELMFDPVQCEDGNVYERLAI